jgi:hypothetical protein
LSPPHRMVGARELLGHGDANPWIDDGGGGHWMNLEDVDVFGRWV